MLYSTLLTEVKKKMHIGTNFFPDPLSDLGRDLFISPAVEKRAARVLGARSVRTIEELATGY